MKNLILLFLSAFFICNCSYNKSDGKRLTDYVNPLLGTATLWDSIDLGYTPTRRAWGAEVFPGASLPNAMVQASPVTLFGSGSGYQYEDTVIYAFTHTNKGHWNLCQIPLLPFTGDVAPDDYCSGYDHKNESATPGYYRVYLKRYGIDPPQNWRFPRHPREAQACPIIFNLSRGIDEPSPPNGGCFSPRSKLTTGPAYHGPRQQPPPRTPYPRPGRGWRSRRLPG